MSTSWRAIISAACGAQREPAAAQRARIALAEPDQGEPARRNPAEWLAFGSQGGAGTGFPGKAKA